MTQGQAASSTLWSRGMLAVLVAQFLSAAADNALLFAALAVVRHDRYPSWSEPLLQEFFVGTFILLAPFVGPLADSLPKGRVMLMSNGLKLAGALGMCVGLNPFVAYAVVGAGAAAYSPAKYGILSELVPTHLLVKANGLLEGSTIAAILGGTIAGGALADWSVSGGLLVATAGYAAAALANLLIPRLPPAHPLRRVSLSLILRDFGTALRAMFRHPDTNFSMAGTSLFWGTGSTLRFVLIAWVPVALGITTNRMPANLQGVMAVGIVGGAALAAKFITLQRVDRVLPAGLIIGASVCVLATVTQIPAAFAVMALLGAAGGYFIVPLNALLQETGRDSVGAGHAIAVQNLLENFAMLVMVGLYMLAARAGFAVTHIAVVFGLGFVAAVGLLWLLRLRGARRSART